VGKIFHIVSAVAGCHSIGLQSQILNGTKGLKLTVLFLYNDHMLLARILMHPIFYQDCFPSDQL